MNDDRGGWTELRVHGVSGAAPETMLNHLQVTRVAGDSTAGFYRRRWDAASISADTATDRLEAYSWGGLTAGSAQRALWLLLVPFLLVNVAFWAMPSVPGEHEGGRWRVRRLAESVQRLFGLSITLTLMLATISVSMDLVGWQCVRSTTTCADTMSWLGFLTWSWLDLPGRRLAVTAAVPLATVGLLWWLGRKTWRSYEATVVPGAESTHQVTPLENRKMWNGVGPVRKLRSVHVTASIAVVGTFALAPLVIRASGPVVLGALIADLLLIAVSVILVCLPSMSDPPVPPPVPSVPPPVPPVLSGSPAASARRDVYTFLPWVALAIDAVVIVVLCRAGSDLVGAAPSALPWFAGCVQALIETQAGLLLIMLGLLLGLRRWAPAQPAVAPAQPGVAPAAGRSAGTVSAERVWWGLASVVFMTLALVIAAGFAAGLGLRVADLLGTPAPDVGAAGTFVVPVGYFWAAAMTVPVAVLAVVLGALGLVLLWRQGAAELRTRVVPAYPEQDLVAQPGAPADPAREERLRRARAIADIWVRATVSGVGERLIGVFVAGVVAALAAGLVCYQIDRHWVYDHARWAVTIGSFGVGGFVVGLLYIGRQAYRSPGFRRTVGVLWDLGTFWPRAVHPLAPPCYAERTIPDLLTRIRYLGVDAPDGHVVLSCHSQGTVIGAAVVLQLAYEESRPVALLTYGSPLRTLYARFFPAYFNVTALLRTGSLLIGPDNHVDPGDVDPGARTRWPWRNLYRRSDPIGGPILVEYAATELSRTAPLADQLAQDNNDVDRQLIDPAFARPDGDTCYPAPLGHSGYPDDPAFDASMIIVRALRTEA